MKRDISTATLLQIAGAAGGAVVLLYAIGGLVLSLRYEGFGLNGQEAAALSPREMLLFTGARSLALWALLGLVLVLGLRWGVARAGGIPRRRTGLLAGAVVAAALTLLVLAHVWWPLAALAAAAVVLTAEACWPDAPVRRALVATAAVTVVALAYEADRLTYRLNWTCIDLAEERQDRCGFLIAQHDRGYYVGARRPPDAPPDRAYRLVFVPAERVEETYSARRTATVIDSSADARRESPLTRLLNVNVR